MLGATAMARPAAAARPALERAGWCVARCAGWGLACGMDRSGGVCLGRVLERGDAVVLEGGSVLWGLWDGGVVLLVLLVLVVLLLRSASGLEGGSPASAL